MVVRPEFADALPMSLARKLLLALFLVSLTGSAFGAGTFASFNATTSNATSTFATGSLILSNKVNTATACLSSGGTGTFTNGNSNSSCDALFSALTARSPGESATVALTLKNEGNVTGATGITGVGTACSASDTPNTGGATATLYHGAGDPCGYIQIKVQETQSDLTTAVKCLYDGDGPNAGACGTGGTVTNFVSTTTTTPMAFNTASVAAGDSRYVVMTLSFPNGAAGNENQYMGRLISFAAQWTLTQ